MATQLIGQSNGGTCPDSLLRWRAYHVFYHADRDRMLRELAWPLMLELASLGVIDRFYFVRYSLGGPHLRLRWRLKDENTSGRAEEVLQKRAAGFFDKYPSKAPVAQDQILATNRAIATTDPAARADVSRVYADNSWRQFTPVFEINRYGGADHIGASIDLFCISSLAILKMLDERGNSRRDWINSAMMRLALQLAWGLAGDEEDFVRLAAYASEAWGDSLEPCIREADLVFSRQEKQITELVIAELESVCASKNCEPSSLVNISRGLAAEISGLSRQAHWPITSSHIHMTANRIGLNNPEEVYLSRLLWRGVERLRQWYPGTWRLLWLRHSALPVPIQDQSMDEVLEFAMRSPILWKASA